MGTNSKVPDFADVLVKHGSMNRDTTDIAMTVFTYNYEQKKNVLGIRIVIHLLLDIMCIGFTWTCY